MPVMGIQSYAAITIGMVLPPLGSGYDTYFVDSLHCLLDTTIVRGGTAVYLLLVSPDLLY